MSWFNGPPTHLSRIWPRLKDGMLRLLMGRRFMSSLDSNRAAADHLDRALKELLERP
ncbi:hypothetical protein CLV78_10114 [Aliiruegeria haliotis]|uniref:Uncharacterized protein n=1 Tax=Aliiruegeria haliotis TaxID=1280846 RepID=A0A2T0RXL1_9RHOB|nr:hypothetical protein CLV78_10114 [Aliiruegeria haliotis]